MSVMELARAERADLLALLESLDEDQWRVDSLCAGWTVHDVVAHMLSYDELTAADLMRRLAGGWFHPDRANALGLAEYRRRSPAELIDLLREHLTPSGLTAGMGGAIGLTDGLVHHQDIRRPLGLHRQVPAERVRAALPTALFAPVVRGILRVWDVRLVATDMDWAFGRGPEVTGPGEALLLTVAGRRHALDELEGSGWGRVAARLPA